MPTITQLEYLVAVDEERHFGKAAEKCHVSQPSLSTQIQKLEEDLEVVIFDRSKKPIMVTDAGSEIIEQANVILREHRKLRAIAQSEGHEPRGDFHLAVIPTLAPYLIPIFVSDFAHRFPKVRLKVNEYKTEDIIRLLVDDKIDAGILVTPLGDDRLIERHLFFEPFYAYVSNEHKLSKKKTLAETDLTFDDLWLLEEGHCFRDQVLKVCANHKQHRVLENVEFAGGNLETVKNLAKRSSGYTLLPELAIGDLSENELQENLRKFKKPVPTREVSLIHSRTQLKETIIKAIEDAILLNLPRKLKSLKRQDIEVIDVI